MRKVRSVSSVAEKRSEFRAIIEDINWLRKQWWEDQGRALSEADIRRGSATLSLLLVNGLIGKLWRQFGFTGGEPTLEGPDIEAIAKAENLRLEMAASLIAGGGRSNNMDAAFIGAFRIDHPKTGVRADADEGFAVSTTTVLRDVCAGVAAPGPLDEMIHRSWRISQYLDAPGAIRRGEMISRKEIIKYFRNYAGGVHHDLLTQTHHRDTDKHLLVSELEKHVRADTLDGLYFELLSIGQSVGRSTDIGKLLTKLEEAATP